METLWMMGINFLVILVLEITTLLYKHLLPYILVVLFGVVKLNKYGRYAVITGANRGIGRAFAIEMASHGMDLILIGRAKDELEVLKMSIVDKYGVEVLIFIKDFSTEYGYDDLKEFLIDKDIGILINNAGVNADFPEYYQYMPEKTKHLIFTVNQISHLKMVDIVLPGMLYRNRGAILEISSLVGVKAFPLFSIYGCSKASGSYFMECLRHENRKSKIFFQTMRPGIVATSMSKRKASIICPSPESFVWWATRTIGRTNDITGYPVHEFMRMFLVYVPGFLFYPGFFRFALSMRAGCE